ncbi:dynactin subunit 6-like [Harmonia axyridis]|uniref:dynactin subunit 6-like n=1 Tax=Harmonia axyridis TaxID=115357 RepID=UPI001E279915|nr:dynactin subunit 6-like [Harmonia axyridis]
MAETRDMPKTSSIKICPGALVCEEARLRGDITISKDCIIHPMATIIAEAGPIIIGESCLIEEQSKIIYRLPFDKVQNKDNIEPLIIGPHNVFEVGCHVEACKIGSNNVFESKCFVSNKVTVTDGCIIGAGCQLKEEQELKENIIVYGERCHMREGLSKPLPQYSQMETLMKIIPNYHHYRKPNIKPK